MGGIFSSPKAPTQSAAVEAGISRRETEARDAELREKQRAAARRRRMLGGAGLGSGLMPEELRSPLESRTKLGIDRNPQ